MRFEFYRRNPLIIRVLTKTFQILKLDADTRESVLGILCGRYKVSKQLRLCLAKLLLSRGDAGKTRCANKVGRWDWTVEKVRLVSTDAG
jgi:hypothetical protein